jgi:predicted transcriptional regulator
MTDDQEIDIDQFNADLDNEALKELINEMMLEHINEETQDSESTARKSLKNRERIYVEP